MLKKADDAELLQALMDYMRQQGEKEAKDDGVDFADPFNMPDEHGALLHRIYYEDRNGPMFDKWAAEDSERVAELRAEGKQEDPADKKARGEARVAEIAEWLKENVLHRASYQRPEPKEHEKRHRELMETDAEYRAAAKAIESLMFPFSFLDGKFLPTIQEYYDEMERQEAEHMRYPHGFRHYENYELYRQ